MALLETLQDSFNGTTLDPKWTAQVTSTATTSVSGGTLNLATGNTGAPRSAQVTSTATYEYTGSYFRAKMVPGVASAIAGIHLIQATSTGDYARLYRGGTSLLWNVQGTRGVAMVPVVSLGTYNATTMRYLRIRVDLQSIIYAGWSADGVTWTEATQTANVSTGWTAGATTAFARMIVNSNSADPVGVIAFDDVNTPIYAGIVLPDTLNDPETITGPSVASRLTVAPASLSNPDTVNTPTVTVAAVVTPNTVTDTDTVGPATVITSTTLRPTTVADPDTVGPPSLIVTGPVQPATITDPETITGPSVTVTIYERPKYRASTGTGETAARDLTFTIPATTRVGDQLLLGITVSSLSAAPITPAGWTVLQSTTQVFSGITHTTYARTAWLYDAGTTFSVTFTGSSNLAMAGVLGVYKSSVIVDTFLTDQTSGALQLIFGPAGDPDPGFTRVALGAAVPTLAGNQLLLSTPATSGSTVAGQLRQQATSGGADGQGVFLADYDAGDSRQAQLNAATPSRAHTRVYELQAVPHHEGTFNAYARLKVRRGTKVDPVGDSAKLRGRISAYARIKVQAFSARSVHRTNRDLTFMTPGPSPTSPFWVVVINPGPGIVSDHFRGGRISGTGTIAGKAGPTHRTGAGGQIHAYGDLRQRRERPHRYGTVGAIEGYARMSGRGLRTYDDAGRGGTITGYARMRVTAGIGRVNYLTGYVRLRVQAGTGAHRGAGNPTIGRPLGPPLHPDLGGVAGGSLYGRGRAQYLIDERYTQIRGVGSLWVTRGKPGPARQVTESAGGTIVGIGIVTMDAYLMRRPEDIPVDVVTGDPLVQVYPEAFVEDYLLRALPGNQLSVVYSEGS